MSDNGKGGGRKQRYHASEAPTSFLCYRWREIKPKNRLKFPSSFSCTHTNQPKCYDWADKVSDGLYVQRRSQIFQSALRNY
jgi:hypothetical protein